MIEIWRGNGRTKSTIGVYLRWVRRFSRRWRDQGQQPIRGLTAKAARRFARWYARERQIDEERVYAGVRSALQAWAFALRTLGEAPPAWSRERSPKKLRPILREYCEYRRGHRGIAESTLQWEVRHLLEFFSWLRTTGRRPSRIRVIDIDSFVVKLSSRLGPKTISRVCCTLRSFLRFMTTTGRLHHDLASSVMSPIVSRRDRPPRALPWEDVRRILAAIDTKTRTGLRNRTALLLMATYGMGAAEVRALELDDVDWHGSTLRVRRPKTGANILLPLLSEIASTLSDYLRHGRPSHVQTRALFLSARAPHRPISSGALRHAVRQYARAAGVVAPILGTHVLRHSHATRQIDLGARPKVVGDILGHRDPASTSAYVAVATRHLRPLALPVPR